MIRKLLHRRSHEAAPNGQSVDETQNQQLADAAKEDPTVDFCSLPTVQPISIHKLPDVSRECYSIGREIARGGMGRILAAEDRRLGRPVVIKELINNDSMHRRRFEREALITARLQHPSIVNVYEAGRWPSGEPFYTMNHVPGRTLDEVIAATQSVKERLGLILHVIRVAEALAYAHGQGIVHRDLKPANILIGSYGETVVIDWGLAKDLTRSGEGGSWDPVSQPANSDLTLAGVVMGTPAYMAPEQATGKTIDHRTDVYAIAALLYHVLAGRAPYKGKDSSEILTQIESGPPPSLAEAEGAPNDLVAIVDKAMARDPDDRYPTAKELADELNRFQTGQLVAAHSYTTRELVLRWVRRHRAPVTVAAVALVVLGIVGTDAVRRVIRARDRAEQALSMAEESGARAAARADEITLVQARTWLDRAPVVAMAWHTALSPDSP